MVRRIGDIGSSGQQVVSYLKAETGHDEDVRRLIEQQGNSNFAKILQEHQVREERDASLAEGLENELEGSVMEHPALSGQNWDGMNDIDQLPNLDRESKIKLENAKREKQLRKENNYTPSPRWAPEFKP